MPTFQSATATDGTSDEDSSFCLIEAPIVPEATAALGGTTTTLHLSSVTDCYVTRFDKMKFLEDLLHKSFPDRKPSESGSEDDRETLVLDSELGDIGLDEPQSCSRSCPHTHQPWEPAASTLISEAVWPRIWRQFCVDVCREDFSVDGHAFHDAPSAFAAVRSLMLATIVQRKAEVSMAPDAGPSPRGQAAAQTALMHLQQVHGWIQKKSGEVSSLSPSWIRSSPAAMVAKWTLDKVASSGTSWLRSLVRHQGPVEAEADWDPFSEEVVAASERMARLVLLLSQQSVMGLPFEELYHRFVTPRETAEGASNLVLESVSGPMRVMLSATSQPNDTAVPSPQSTSSFVDVAASSATSSSSSRNSALDVLSLQPSVRIQKDFKLTSVDDGNDPSPIGSAHRTLLTIVATVTVDLFSDVDPVTMTWHATAPPPQTYSSR